MEKAIYFSELEKIKNRPISSRLLDNFKRIYFGNEFCRFLIPDKEDLKQVLLKIPKKYFSLTTPAVINDFDISKIIKLFNVLVEYKPDSEVIINNLGLLQVLQKYKSLKPVLGRILSHLVFYFSEKEIRVKVDMVSLFKQYKIERFEIDNYEKSIINNMGLSISMHVPYAYVTNTRWCIFKDGEYLEKNSNCKINCRTSVKVKYPIIQEHFIFKGNSQFLLKKSVSKQNVSNINRLVMTKGAPL